MCKDTGELRFNPDGDFEVEVENEEIAKWLVDLGQHNVRFWGKQIFNSIGNLALDTTCTYEDNVDKVRRQLDRMDRKLKSTSIESILSIKDTLKYIAYFQTVDNLEDAYNNLTTGRHKGYITNIKPQLDKDFLKITINMGVDDPSDQFIASVGEVELRLGFPDTKEILD